MYSREFYIQYILYIAYCCREASMLVHCVLLTIIIALKVLIAYPLLWSYNSSYNMGLYIQNPTSIEFMRKRPIFYYARYLR